MDMNINEIAVSWIKAELAMNGVLLNTSFKMIDKGEVLIVKVKDKATDNGMVYSYVIERPMRIMGTGNINL